MSREEKQTEIIIKGKRKWGILKTIFAIILIIIFAVSVSIGFTFLEMVSNPSFVYDESNILVNILITIIGVTAIETVAITMMVISLIVAIIIFLIIVTIVMAG